MTHAELVDRAAAWLRGKRHGCLVVLTEHTGGREIPDAIGWNRIGASTLVECKTSRGDLLRDSKKPWRRDDLREFYGVGRTRWYLLDGQSFADVPAIGILPKWGVAITTANRVQVLREPEPFDEPEIAVRTSLYLVRELQRFQLQGMTPLTFLQHHHTRSNGCNGSWRDIYEAQRIMGLRPPLRPEVRA